MGTEKEILDAFLEKAENEITEGIASGNGVYFWEAAGKALEEVKENRETIERWGIRQFKTLLGSLSKTPAREQQLIRMMTARQLVMDMQEGTTNLKDDSAVREATKEKVAEVLLKLGSIGAQLLMRIL